MYVKACRIIIISQWIYPLFSLIHNSPLSQIKRPHLFWLVFFWVYFYEEIVNLFEDRISIWLDMEMAGYHYTPLALQLG